MKMTKILVIGATSTIAQQVARLLCMEGVEIHLLGRDQVKLNDIAADLQVRGAKVSVHTVDLNDLAAHQKVINESIDILGGLDLVLLAYGTLPDQPRCEQDTELATREITTNYLSAQSLLSILANHMEAQGSGSIAVISSVAGDRGRKSNYIYGSAKAGLTVYLQGLRNRLATKNVHVLTIKPGFVDTPMTRDFKKGLLWVGPDKVARDIVRAIRKKRDVLYTPWYWQWIMLIIKLIPERIFKKMNL
jgi:decaprenylphospho-beta-D-erythro-pentofuranosid-2-ulose 2-reductase